MTEPRVINGTVEELKAKIKEFLDKGYVCDNKLFGIDPYDAVKNGGSLLVCDSDEFVEKGFLATGRTF